MTDVQSGASGLDLARMRRATKDDLQTIAIIHKKAYSRSHFTALLPDDVLMRYYRYFLEEGSYIYLALCGAGCGDVQHGAVNGVLGFAVFGNGISQKIACFKRQCATDILLASLRHPWCATKKFLNALLVKLKNRPGYAPAGFLLLSIAVAVPQQGIGRRLLIFMLDAARQTGCQTLGLYVNADNLSALNAYFAAGFIVKDFQAGQFYMEKFLEQI